MATDETATAARRDDDGVVDLGLVPEEVLLLAGRPDAVPSAWWTPWLAALPVAEQAELVGRARAGLVQDGLLRPDGRPDGPLAVIADVARGATVVTTFVTQLPGGHGTRGSFVVADDAALLLVAVPEQRGQRVQRCDLRAAATLLAVVLDPCATARTDLDPDACVPVPVAAQDLDAIVPAAARRSTVRLVRVVRDDGVQHELLSTFVGQDDGLHLLRALPAGDVTTSRVPADDVLDAAAALLGLRLVVA